MKKTLSLFMAVLLVGMLMTGCSKNEVETINDISVCDTVDFHSGLQEAYITTDLGDVLKFAKGKKPLDKPEPIIISWSAEGQNKQYTVSISENSDMSGAVTYSVSESHLPVYNLKTSTQYYWTYANENETSEVSSFKTSSDAPRNLYVDGVKNVRDLGGWKTENGKTVNQGLIFRCGRLNKSSAEEAVIEITDEGIAVMRDQLGIKSEIDLRKTENGEIGAITSSPVGESVNYYNCPMTWEDDIFLNNREQILSFFEILSDESNYPIIFHCNIGTDRTGMMAFLIGALCGVGEDDLKRDYLMSNFADIGEQRTIADLVNSGYYKAVKAADGSVLSEKTYNALAQLGVPEAQLDAVISIMTK